MADAAALDNLSKINSCCVGMELDEVDIAGLRGVLSAALGTIVGKWQKLFDAGLVPGAQTSSLRVAGARESP
jgi:hypothetical protein